MRAAGLALIAASSVVLAAALLLNASAGKLVSSRLAEVALRQTLGLGGAAPLTVLVRGLAIVEGLAALGLVIDWTRTIAALITSLLGVSFVLFGVIAQGRGVNVACGCLGGTDQRPVGVRNVAVGTVLALLFPLIVSAPTHMSTPVAACWVSIAAITLSIYLNRRFAVKPLLRRPVLGGDTTG